MVNSIAEVGNESIIVGSFDGKIYCLNNRTYFSLEEIQLHEGQLDLVSTTQAEYERSFNAIHAELQKGTCDKIVLSRIKEVQSKIDLSTLFSALNKTYTGTYNYVFSSPETGTWMGASPELLCSVNDSILKTVALAGTKLESENWTEKERVEQRFVTDYITKIVSKYSAEIKTIGPYDQIAGPVMHLKTEINAKIPSNKWTNLIQDLHPTPATCGLPTSTAKQLIIEIEKHNRALYTGFIAIREQESELCFVNLRCMRLTKNSAYLYVGGGLTVDSQCDSEWQETERKALTLEQILSK